MQYDTRSETKLISSRQLSSKKVVAIKVLDIDDADFRTYGDQKDEQIKDFNREIRILRQAQDSGAENLNPMIEAMSVHSQLWLICEHCPGGSVKTLVRNPPDLDIVVQLACFVQDKITDLMSRCELQMIVFPKNSPLWWQENWQKH